MKTQNTPADFKDQEIARLRKQLEKEQRKRAKLQSECERMRKRLDVQRTEAIGDILQGVVPREFMHNLIEEFLRQGPDISEALQDRLQGLLETLDESDFKDTKAGWKKLAQYLYGHSSEKIDQVFEKLVQQCKKKAKKTKTNKPKDPNDKFAAYCRSIEKGEKALYQAEGWFSKAAKAASSLNPDDPLLRQLAKMAESVPKALAKSAPTPSVGRVVPESKKNAMSAASPEQAQGDCPKCGCAHDKEVILHTSEFLRSSLAYSLSVIDEVARRYNVVRCPECHSVYVDRPADAPVPYSHAPGCQHSADLVIGTGMIVGRGWSLNRPLELLGTKELQMAKEGLGRALTTWTHPGGLGHLLYNAIVKRAQSTAKHIGADESPLRVLERDDMPGKTHIMVCTSVPLEPFQFAVYQCQPSRSGECIANFFQGWNFETINRDAYSGYPAAFKRPEMVHLKPKSQICLVHCRRQFIEALMAEKDWIVGANPDDPETLKQLIDKHVAHDPIVLISHALLNFSGIYHYEKFNERKPGETLEMQLKRIAENRRLHCAPLMDGIDDIVNDLRDRFVQYKDGRWECKLIDTPIGKALTYWLNHREGLYYYLSNPWVPPDSNNVERCIRAVATLRATSKHMKTMGGTETLCILMTLYETAKMNGIKNPTRWLHDFHQALYRHIERKVLTERDQRRKPNQPLHLKIHNIPPEAYADFDFEAWMPDKCAGRY